ncbi:MAG: hypothetical protein Q9218_003497, partial [Villophora microphyllina]
MKTFTLISALLLSLLSCVTATPTPETLPDGWDPITHEEILHRLDTSAASTSPLGKRTPGG